MVKDALYAAAIAGDAHAIAKLEMQAITVGEYGKTILHVESQNGNTERVRFILREFADKNLLVKLTKFKDTALHLALLYGRTEVAEILIDAARHLPVTSFQAFLRQPDQSMYTALHIAVMDGHHPSIVKILVEADPTDTHIQDNQGKTPMYIAVEKGFNDIVEIISTTCTAPSLDGPHGSTVVRIKNLDQAKSPGGTLYKIMDGDALYAAAIAGDADAIAGLEMQADKLYAYDRTILHNESRDGNTEHVRFILREFAHKNLLVKLGYQQETALTWAAYLGHTEVVEVLIDAARHLPPLSPANDNPITSFQAFLRHADKDSEIALHTAVKNGHVDVTKLLVEADPSDRHIQDKNGKTPMYIAVEKRYMEIVKLICTTCTAPSLDGPGGSTALHAAIKHPDHDIEVVNLLIGAAIHLPPSDNDNPVTPFQAFLRQCDEELNTALHLAVLNDKVDIVKLLVEADPSDTHIQNEDGKTPMYIAVEKGYNYIAEIISTTCTAPSWDGPHGAALRINNLDQDDFEYAASYENVGHAMITASQPSGLQSMKSLPQPVNMNTMVLENEGDTSAQLPCISQPCEDATEQDEQVLDMRKSTPSINSHEGIATGETSSNKPDNVLEDIHCWSFYLFVLLEISYLACVLYIWLKYLSGCFVVDELQKAQPTISKESLSQHFGKSLDEEREIFGVSRTAFKNMCRDVGIKRWQYGKRKMGSNSSSKHKRRINNEEPGGIYSTDMPCVHDPPVISYTSQVLSTMDIKAMHNGLIIRFELPELSGKSELEDNVIKRLHLDRNSFRIKYEDDGGQWVLITCDEDVRYCMKMSRSWKKTPINMRVDTTANQ